MLAYGCKKCGKFFVIGYKNGYNETFCSIDCYKKYCENNGYEFKETDIQKIKNALSD